MLQAARVLAQNIVYVGFNATELLHRLDATLIGRDFDGAWNPVHDYLDVRCGGNGLKRVPVAVVQARLHAMRRPIVGRVLRHIKPQVVAARARKAAGEDDLEAGMAGMVVVPDVVHDANWEFDAMDPRRDPSVRPKFSLHAERKMFGTVHRRVGHSLREGSRAGGVEQRDRVHACIDRLAPGGPRVLLSSGADIVCPPAKSVVRVGYECHTARARARVYCAVCCVGRALRHGHGCSCLRSVPMITWGLHTPAESSGS
jgi:hypothetical protein